MFISQKLEVECHRILFSPHISVLWGSRRTLNLYGLPTRRIGGDLGLQSWAINGYIGARRIKIGSLKLYAVKHRFPKVVHGKNTFIRGVHWFTPQNKQKLFERKIQIYESMHMDQKHMGRACTWTTFFFCAPQMRNGTQRRTDTLTLQAVSGATSAGKAF